MLNENINFCNCKILSNYHIDQNCFTLISLSISHTLDLFISLLSSVEMFFIDFLVNITHPGSVYFSSVFCRNDFH